MVRLHRLKGPVNSFKTLCFEKKGLLVWSAHKRPRREAHSQVTVTTVQGIPGYCLSCQQVGVICAGFAGINMHELQDPGDFHLGFKERPGRHNSLAG